MLVNELLNSFCIRSFLLPNSPSDVCHCLLSYQERKKKMISSCKVNILKFKCLEFNKKLDR